MKLIFVLMVLVPVFLLGFLWGVWLSYNHWRNEMTALSKTLDAMYRQLGKRGWDKTAAGWRNVHTGQVATLESAAQQEIDKEAK